MVDAASPTALNPTLEQAPASSVTAPSPSSSPVRRSLTPLDGPDPAHHRFGRQWQLRVATNCANKAAPAKPVGAAPGTVAGADDIVNVTKNAGIPFFTNAAFTTQTLTVGTPAPYVINSSAVSGTCGTAKAMQDKGLKKAAIIFPNVPGAVGSLNASLPSWTKAGIQVQQLPVPTRPRTSPRPSPRCRHPTRARCASRRPDHLSGRRQGSDVARVRQADRRGRFV